MSNERFFRMLSVAVLGLCALAAVPDSQATDAQIAAIEVSADALPIEVTIVKDIDEINAGRFNPALIGFETPSLVPSAVKTTAISEVSALGDGEVDPNL